MAELFFLCFEVVGGGFLGLDLDGDAFDDVEAGFFESLKLIRVIRYDADLAEPEVKENFGTLPIVASIDRKAESFVGLDRIGTFVLKRVSPDLVDDTDASAFLLLIDDSSAAFRLDHPHCLVELRPAVAFDRAENVAGQALRMYPDERWDIGAHFALMEDDKLLGAVGRTIA